MSELKYKKLITILSIAIPLAVAILFGRKIPNAPDFSFLPPIYAGINALTAITLIFALFAIKKRNIALHTKLVQISVGLSVLFLLMYVAYHMTSDSTPFGGEGYIRYVYFFILMTHILLSIFIIPFVLITYSRGISEQFEKHRKIAKITFPLWLYVAITGVVVYFMISPYYGG